MAAASAGAAGIQTGFVSGPIASTATQLQQEQASTQSLNAYTSQLHSHHHQLIQDQHQLHHGQPIIAATDSSLSTATATIATNQRSLNSAQTLAAVPSSSASHQQQHRVQFVQRTSAGTYVNVIKTEINSDSNGGSNDSSIVTNQVKLAAVSELSAGPNVAPGWSRQLCNGDIVYIR